MTHSRIGSDFLSRRLKKLSLELILLVLAFVVCLWLLFIVADMVFEDHDLSFDEHVFSLFKPYITDAHTKVMLFITFFGSQYFLLPANIFLAGTFLFIKRYRWYSLKIASVSITSTAVLFLLKDVLRRQRPMVPVISRAHGYSFPSGHSFSSMVFFGILAYIAFRTIKNSWLRTLTIICCCCFTILVGFSRIYLKLHFASDVIAGFCLGLIWLILAKWLLIKAENTAPTNASDIRDKPDRF